MLTTVRKGEVALLVLRENLKTSGVHLTSDFKRNLGNIAKNTGVPFDQLLELTEEITTDLVNQIFADAKK